MMWKKVSGLKVTLHGTILKTTLLRVESRKQDGVFYKIPCKCCLKCI